MLRERILMKLVCAHGSGKPRDLSLATTTWHFVFRQKMPESRKKVADEANMFMKKRPGGLV